MGARTGYVMHGLVAVLVLTLAAPASGSLPGKNGLIAYERSVGGQSFVYTARSDGKRVRRLACSLRDTAGKCFDGDPAWSHDGRRLAIHNSDGIAIVDLNGRLTRQVLSQGPPSSEPGLDPVYYGPVWSPTSRALAYMESAQDGDDIDVYTVNIATGRTRRVSAGIDPAWSVRNRIAIGGFGLQTQWPDGRRPRRVFRDETLGLDWSPGGRRLVFTDSDGIWTIRATGRGGRRELPVGKTNPQDAKWSPDGKIIIWVDFATRRPVLRAFNLRTGRVRSLPIRGALNPDWQPRR